MGASASFPATHRSLNCRTATVVDFCNETQHEVETLWLGYDGSETQYCKLQPGQRVRQPTFTAHPWVFRVPGSPSKQLVVQDQAVFYAPPATRQDELAVEARISCARGMAWSPASHAAFPPGFRAATATLLCCHHRLAACRPDSTARDAASKSGQCGRWLCRLSRLLLEQGTSFRMRAEGPQAAPRHQQQACCLGDLPKDVLLDVLAAAAPFVPLLVKPAFPHGIEPGELSTKALQLFRQAEGPGRNAAGHAAAGAGEGQAQALAGLPA
ncbi:hypothetical protein ABPG77_004920 [Micractinium sp. CCAP 211/92]